MMQTVIPSSGPPPRMPRLMLLLMLAMPCSVNAYTWCNTGYYLSGTDCLPYYGGYTSSSSIPAGSFAHKGTTVTTSTPAGYSTTTTGQIYPTACTIGQYSAGGSTSCQTCSANKQCSQSSQSSAGAGYFAYGTNGKWGSQKPCPPGYTCSGTAQPTQLSTSSNPGQYTQTSGYASSASSCTAGYYCPDPTRSNFRPCPTFFYSTSSVSTCTVAAAGTYISSSSSAGVNCGAGQYSKPGYSSCTICDGGFYCAVGVAVPTAINTGQYVGGSGTTANPNNCPYGSYCSLMSVLGTCPNGYTSALGYSSCTKCEAGYYCSGGTQVACSTYYWAAPGATFCTITPDGNQLDTTKRTAGTQCGIGSFSNSGTSYICTICPQGYYCPDTTQKYVCGAGYYCPLGTTSLSTVCPDWFECTFYTMCPDGKYMTAGKICADCPAGYTCAGRSYTTLTAVSTGYYSPLGVSVQFICPAGYACSTNVAVACSPGYFSIEGELYCTICPIYWACPNTELDYTQQIDCRTMRGMYGPATGQTACTPAAAGEYIQLGQTGPTSCPAGTFSFGAAMACHECPPGYICPSTVKPQMTKCLQGTYNLLYSQTSCTTCEAGYMCSGQQRLACPSFKYSHAGWGYCLFAPQGYYLALGDRTQIFACPQGTYAIFGSGDSAIGSSTCKTCPVGHQCSNPAIVPQPCLPGTYQPSTGQASCLSCSAGTYSLFHEIECHTSPAGYKLASVSRVPRMCPPQTYSSPASSTCTNTPDTYYTPAATPDSNYHMSCQWGFYCSISGTQQTEVPYGAGGTYFPLFNIAGASPSACNAGYYCPYGTMKQYPCPAGHYCGPSSNLPTPCPAGYFNVNIMQTSLTACTDNPCPTSYICNIGSKYPQPCSGTCDTSLMAVVVVVTCPDGTYAGNDVPSSPTACNACWEGHYCPTQLAATHTFPIPCPKGTYNPTTSGATLSDCLPCPIGMVCPYFGQRTLQTGLVCQGGYACPAKTTSFRQHPCPATTYSDATPYLDDTTNCATCPDGYLCTAATNVLYNPMTLCPAGSYCIAGVQTPCAAGKYSTQIGATSSAVCLPCPAGYYCLIGTTDFSANTCAAGYYCPEGSSVAAPNACPTGTYSTLTGMKSSSECTICPVGYYCVADAVTGIIAPIACPAGTYSSRISVVSLADGASRGCLACPAGYYCPTSLTFEPIACPAGSQSAASATTCTPCPVNFYCDQVATTMTGAVPIPDGFYYAGGEGLAERPYHISDTYSCPQGYYCAGNTKTACPKGYYQNLYGQTSFAACLETPAGYYTDSEASISYFDTPCPTGMYCLAGTTSAIGYALSEGKTGYAILCPKGTFKSLPGGRSLADCAICPAGYVCSEYTTEPLICSPGYYCPQASESMQACPTGTFGSGYGLTVKSDCSNCFGGRYCSSIASAYISGFCDQMYYCVQNSNTPVPQYKTVGQTTDFRGGIYPVGDVCAAGGYCARGSKFPLPCPAGKYNPYTSKQYVTDCIDCPQGKYCSGAPSLTRTDLLEAMKPYVPAADPTGDCYAGYYCTGAAFSPKQFTAPAGTYTLAGAWQTINCGVGTYNPFIAQSSCLPCPAGYYCPNTAMTEPLDCPQGYFCPSGSSSYLSNPCPAGTYGIYTNYQDSSDCQPCTSGKYCATTGLSNPTGLCSAGHYCLQNAITATPSGTTSTSQGQCPRFHWCATGVGMGVPSMPGYYDTSLGRTSAFTTLQVAGSWSHTVSATSTYFSTPTMATGTCAAGYFCQAGSSWAFSAADYCDIGENCPAGASGPTTCPPGKYQPNPLQATCFDCPKGFFCDGTQTSDLTTYKCPKGYYCPTGTLSDTQYPCPAGTYNDHFGATSLSECTLTPPGYFMATTAATAITSANKCADGYYCKRGSTTGTPTDTTHGNQCTAGNYCPSGTARMIPCTPGKYCATAGLSTPTGNCAAGYYCSQSSTVATTANCPAGYYCPTGTDRPIPCPAGTYQPYTLKTASTDCLPCVEQYYCPTAAMTTYTAYSCTAGFYCPTGSRVGTAVICPIGHYCPAASSAPLACNNQYQDQTGATTCKNCEAGHYCTATTSTKCTPQNDALNYYCPGGLVSVGKVACAAGTYNFVDGSRSVNDCWSCPPGYFCPVAPATSLVKIQQCTKGYYCLAGVDAPTICPVGFYCPAGTNVPIPCPRGYYGSTTGLMTSTCSGYCTAGYYCTFQTTTASVTSLCINGVIEGCISGSTSPTQNNCGAGNYCKAGTVLPTPCPIGTYSTNLNNQVQGDCTQCTAGQYCYDRGLAAPQADCEAGYYCPTGSNTAYAEGCPEGHFCPAGSAAPTQCLEGSYQPNQIQTSCIDCEAGFYCPDQGMTAPIICEPGYYCPSIASQQMTPCPEGTWSWFEGLTLESSCLRCSYGKYCPYIDGLPLTAVADATECPILQYCYDTSYSGLTEAQMLTLDCGVGEICAANTIVPDKCPPGTYTNPAETSGMSSANCLSCPTDYYCPDWGLLEADLQSCPDGYVCMGGAIDPSNRDDVTIKLCPAGSYCLQNYAANGDTQTQNLCKVNYYNPIEGQSACFPCLAGFSCQEVGLQTPYPCPAGSYCPPYDASSGVDNVVPCPAGTYSSDLYLTDVSQCNDCPPGKYCEEGSSGFSGMCDEGYVCTGGQSTPTPTGTFTEDSYDKSLSGPCPTGHFCPSGSSFPRKCASGTYQDETGQSSCKACPEGYYCAEIGLTNPSGTCEPGFYCISGSVYAQPYDFQSGRICAVGHFCVNGLEYNCLDGYYAPVTGLSLCYNCPPGFYCNVETGTITPTECTTGHYCPAMTGDPIQCPKGTYTQSFQTGLESEKQCSDCPTGYYCDDGTFNQQNTCNAGFYCLSGAYEPKQAGLECPGGYYCLAGTKLPTACPDGKYTLIGAKSEDDCTDCLAGYYCVRYISSSAMIVCPKGYYCPPGQKDPEPCPKGTYNFYPGATSLSSCKNCPAGTACDVVGIADYNAKMCPPGYYCPLGTYSPIPCAAGTFRPSQSGAGAGPTTYSVTGNLQQTCFSCVPGYYCPTKATVVPELCPKGSFCLKGSIYDTKCPAGYYCPAGSNAPTPCPKGFYCTGASDVYAKCPFGTYCPPKSAYPINCPNGSYGSGNSNNFDEASGCIKCGRGLYSEDDPTQCFDCTPGYVCLGATSSARPKNVTMHNGYQCPMGFFCPLGSYEPQFCPSGTYSKQLGSTRLQNCLPCKIDYYNDLPGQPGCKQCGPTSYANGGATTCQCIGANRDFIKSIGSCLCGTGYQPKNNAKNVDSIEDCEQIVKTVCRSDQQVDLTGKCVDAKQQEVICAQQCPGVGGSFVAGTGLCQCTKLTDVTEACNSTCQATIAIQSKLGPDGQLTLENPVTKQISTVDPSTIPGYFGDFVCQTTDTSNSDCTVVQMGMATDGSFTYNFSPNQDVLNKTNISDNTQNMTAAVVAQRKRKLQGTTVEQNTIPQIKNPTVCVTEGSAVFFNVDAKSLNYPSYFKDSFLNTNPTFDYGPFLKLEQMILNGDYVSTFSFIFKTAGVYVFTNKGSGTMTPITVVKPSQKCQGSVNGVGVSMVTTESLNNYGVSAGLKGIQPDWWFISLSIIAMLSFLFFVMSLFILAHNTQIKGTSLLSKGQDIKESAIYYDKIIKNEKNSMRSYCCGLIKTRVSKVDAQDSDNIESKQQEYNVKYQDLEQLLADFHKAQAVLNRQLQDREARKDKVVDAEGNLVQTLSAEDALLKEVKSLLLFVKQNKSVINQCITKEQKPQDKDQPKLDDLGNDMSKKVATALFTVLQKKLVSEQQFEAKLKTQLKEMQSVAFTEVIVKNEHLKQKLLDEYQQRLSSSSLSESDKEQLLIELHAKMSHINDLATEEQAHQNHNLQEMLKRRASKKDRLQKQLEQLADKKVKEDDKYQQRLIQIRQNEQQTKQLLDQENDELRAKQTKEIENELAQKRLKIVSAEEKRLEDFKRKNGKGNPETELQFADMLMEYGNKVKKLDADLAQEKQKQLDQFEQKLRERKQNRIREIEEQRKQQEHLLNEDTVKINSKVNNDMQQIQYLINPIKNEEARMQIILNQERKQPIVTKAEDSYKPVSMPQVDDQKEVQTLLAKLDAENEVKRREIEQHRGLIQKQIQSCSSEEEKAKLLKQLEQFDSTLSQQLAQQQEQQQQKLRQAIEQRQQKRRQQFQQMQADNEQQIKQSFLKGVSSKLTQQQPSSVLSRIQAGFNKYEAVQVTENYLNQKNEQEQMQLMNSLFEERATSLRHFMLDLLTQKQFEIDMVRMEFDPVKEFLRQKRVKGLLSLDEFSAALERLTVEEMERVQDIEIMYADREKKVKQDLEVMKYHADNEQLKTLKDRQCLEKVSMFQELMKGMDDKDQMKQYLKQSCDETVRELEQFKRFADKEKQQRVQELKEAMAQREKEMMERQERLVNVDEMLRKEEAKHMERFKRQREEMLARKLAEQQRELLKEMNQKDVDSMLEKHKKDISVMDGVLEEEQQRQMEKMRERMKNRNANKAREQVLRQIKLAEIAKQKQLEAEQAKLYEKAGGDLATSALLEKQKEQIGRLVDKAALMQRMCQKQCYSRKIYFKRHIANQQKLNSFLGRGILTDWASSKGDIEDVSGMSQLSLNTEDLKLQVNDKEERITYAVLLQHIQAAQQTYDAIRK